MLPTEANVDELSEVMKRCVCFKLVRYASYNFTTTPLLTLLGSGESLLSTPSLGAVKTF